jgi:protein-S-isoprenylcysteine O-methyltransferase Ste14
MCPAETRIVPKGLNPIQIFAVVAVMGCWIIFGIVFISGRNREATQDKKRDPRSIAGIALQAAAFAVVWSIRRPMLSSFANSDSNVQLLLGSVAVALAVVSSLMAISAQRALGKEWSLTARVVTDHKLATQGPYRITRNPIYTGMFGMLVATGLLWSHWIALFGAVVLFLIGTFIRIRSEERLLAEAFGTEYEDYKRRVPALIPGIL